MKRIILFLLAAMMALSLISCGASNAGIAESAGNEAMINRIVGTWIFEQVENSRADAKFAFSADHTVKMISIEDETLTMDGTWSYLEDADVYLCFIEERYAPIFMKLVEVDGTLKMTYDGEYATKQG